jgi:hypothetical protein
MQPPRNKNGGQGVDSDHQIRYHDWILQQLRKTDEQSKTETLRIGDDQHKKTLVDRNNLDSDRVEG